MTQSVVRIEDVAASYGTQRNVFGLNLFAANHVEVEPSQDPRLVFLASLLDRPVCSVHIGSLALEGDDPREVFGVPNNPIAPYVRIRIGLHGGTFYQLQEQEAKACLFPVASRAWLESIPESIRYFVTCDALALYAVDRVENIGKIQTCLSQAFAGPEQTLTSLVESTDYVVTSGADGWHFTVHTRAAEHLLAVDQALRDAEASIRTYPWYVQHQTDLVWEKRLDYCLKLP